jgi:hypothetical protein
VQDLFRAAHIGFVAFLKRTDADVANMTAPVSAKSRRWSPVGFQNRVVSERKPAISTSRIS